MIGARRLLNAVARLVDDRADDRAQVARLAVHAQLAIGAGAIAENRPDIFDLAPAAQLVDDVVHELEQLDGEVAHRHFLPASEVDQLAVESPARGPPLVLFDQPAVIDAESEITAPELVQLHDDRLRKGRDRNRRPRRSRNVADSELQGAERWMRPDVPPDLLGVVEAVQLHEQIDVLVIFAPRLESIRDPRPGEPPEY